MHLKFHSIHPSCGAAPMLKPVLPTALAVIVSLAASNTARGVRPGACATSRRRKVTLRQYARKHTRMCASMRRSPWWRIGRRSRSLFSVLKAASIWRARRLRRLGRAASPRRCRAAFARALFRSRPETEHRLLLEKLGWALPPQPPPRIRAAQAPRAGHSHRDTKPKM